jgi:hypothetical protein
MALLSLSGWSQATKSNKLAHHLVEIRQCLVIRFGCGMAVQTALAELIKLQSLAAHVPVELDQRFSEPAATITQRQL